MFEIRQGNALDILRTLSDASIHCCVTSPPYWGLRDYSACPCVPQGRLDVFEDGRGDRHTPGGALAFHAQGKPEEDCPKCRGSGKMEAVAAAQVGLESTAGDYISRLVE